MDNPPMDKFFELLQASIGTRDALSHPLSLQEWKEVYRMSKQQGVTAVTFNFVKSLPKEEAPHRALALEWFSAATGIERTLLQMQMVAEDFAKRMKEKQIPVVVLKGIAFAQYYPNPLHRECGDLDCYLMGKKEEGDQCALEMGGRLEESGYKHSHLSYKGLTIENHRFFTDLKNTPRSFLTERHLKELMQEDCTSLGNTSLLSPSLNFNALFLLKHAQGHFIDEGIRMRHVLDWALFLRKEQDHADWECLLPMMEDAHLTRFAGVMTAISVKHLNIDVRHKDLKALAEDAEPGMVNAVLADIMGEQPEIYVAGLWHKTKRIARRFRRMWKFRTLASESYTRMVWNSFAFSSYVKRNELPEPEDTI